jgi:tetratricopeptide (TPR) repeat protein
VRPASQLIEQGIKAYTRGLLDEAHRCWEEALALEPLNDRARAYLDLLAGSRTDAPADPPSPQPPPAGPDPWLEQPKDATSTAAPRADAPVALPAPGPPLAAEAPVQLPEGALTEEPAPEPGRPRRITLTDYAPSPWDMGPAEAPAIVLETDGGLDLDSIAEKSDLRSLVPEQASTTPTPQPLNDVDVWMQGAKELHALGDFSGSLEMIERILKVSPEHPEARAYLDDNETTLIAMYESKLGSMGHIPRLGIKPEEVLWLNLDHRAGFLLAQVDGSVSYEDLFALSGLPRLDTARILATLLQEGVITS